MTLEVASLATTIITSFLIPYVKLGVEKIAEKVTEQTSSAVAEEATSLTKKVWEKIKSVFTGDDANRLEHFEATQGENKDLVEAILKDKLRSDTQLADELNKLINPPVSAPTSVGAQIMKAHIAGIVDARGANFSHSSQVTITGASSVNKPDSTDK